RGNLVRAQGPFIGMRFESTSCVQAEDYDKDGDLDLFVGVRLKPFLYGIPVNGYILNNDGKGRFTNVTEEVAPSLIEAGMITDALWLDLDQDDDKDLVVAGEWMPIKILMNEGGKLVDATEKAGLTGSNGFWNCIKAGDFDGDGDLDLIAGNHGLNTRFKASAEHPVTMHTNDFDGNGTAEQIVSVFNGDGSYPLALRHDLIAQMPVLKRKYLKYESYKNQRVEDIFSPEQLERAVKMEIYMTETSLLINDGKGKFEIKPLPLEAQFSPVYGINVEDFNHDGKLDILMGGNFHRAKPEVGIYDANYGLFLQGKGDGSFRILTPYESGFFTVGEVRDLVTIKGNGKDYVLVGKNDDKLQIFEY
ncbi:MAG: VCBS repeat-containing protein, partial [Bacteroidetes bacterium]|nr:VCBS repeat-containing protein [Bacteroidota bacterium]